MSGPWQRRTCGVLVLVLGIGRLVVCQCWLQHICNHGVLLGWRLRLGGESMAGWLGVCISVCSGALPGQHCQGDGCALKGWVLMEGWWGVFASALTVAHHLGGIAGVVIVRWGGVHGALRSAASWC